MPVFGISLLICLLNLLNAQLQTLSMFQHLLYVLDKREIKLQCVPQKKKKMLPFSRLWWHRSDISTWKAEGRRQKYETVGGKKK